MANKRDWGLMLTGGGIIFAVAAAWATLSSKVERLDEKLVKLEEKQAEPLCLTVLNTQLEALQSGKMAKFKTDLDRMSAQFCPERPSVWMNANATLPMTEAEKQQQLREANDRLANIIGEIEGNDGGD